MFTVKQIKMCCFIMKTRTEVPEMASNDSNVNKEVPGIICSHHYLSNHPTSPSCLSLSLSPFSTLSLTNGILYSVYLMLFGHLTTPYSLLSLSLSLLSRSCLGLKYLGVLILEGFSEVFLILACDSSENTPSHTHTHTAVAHRPI